MRALNMTSKYQADLRDRLADERGARESEATRARALGAEAAQPGDLDPETRLWNAGGHYAMIFCLWFIFLAPIVLILVNWD